MNATLLHLRFWASRDTDMKSESRFPRRRYLHRVSFSPGSRESEPEPGRAAPVGGVVFKGAKNPVLPSAGGGESMTEHYRPRAEGASAALERGGPRRRSSA